MSLTAGSKGETVGRIGLWLGAGSVVVGAHILAAAWAMQRSVAALPDAPEAVYIELAPAPPAPEPVAPVLPELQSFTPPTIATPPEPQAARAASPTAASPRAASPAENARVRLTPCLRGSRRRCGSP